jgi:hypothetical protein
MNLIQSVLFIIALTSLAESDVASAKDFQFGDFQIEITETANNSFGQRDGFIKVRQKNKIIDENSFKKMESLGGSNGFYIPKNQQLQDLFFITKLGDYDDRLLVITRKGDILNLPYGVTYIDPAYLYVVRKSEVEGNAYAIVNLKKMNVIKEGENLSVNIHSKLKSMKPIFPIQFYQFWHPLSN